MRDEEVVAHGFTGDEVVVVPGEWTPDNVVGEGFGDLVHSQPNPFRPIHKNVVNNGSFLGPTVERLHLFLKVLDQEPEAVQKVIVIIIM
jgi:hypothetical protein